MEVCQRSGSASKYNYFHTHARLHSDQVTESAGDQEKQDVANRVIELLLEKDLLEKTAGAGRLISSYTVNSFHCALRKIRS